ncbi:zinc finger CCCH domain-containing protein 67 [Pistacia vera]|uniref:zinc finger CCCH domain-containing protein 67 n=1 Tax=Pistacia vera TaxID=55513 RepID=UPI001262D3F0|nr:zinc finger CCCH domain-containing protein 67 [Pistacia vera]
MEVSEPIPVPNLCNDNTNPQLGLPSSPTKSDLDPSPSDLDHTPELVEECQKLENLDLGEAEEKSSNKEEEEEEGSDSDDNNKNISEVENGNENDNENENGNQMIKKYPYPVRPDAEDCPYYMKNGSCKFGSNCKFNHPARTKNQGAKEKVKEREELMEKPGQSQIECKYYLKTGGCKFGKACRYSHTRAKSPVIPILELNFLGLPIRPGEKECPYYMRNGSCKYGSNCRFNHPDPTAVGGSDSPSGYGNGGSVSSQAASQTSVGSWSSPRALNETAPFLQLMYPPSQVAASQKAEWNGYQGPLYPPERSINPTPPYAMKPPVIETNVYTHQQQQQHMLVDEFPERPGQPDCSFFLKTGDCKFKSNCKYHHPKNRISKSQPCALSDKGLPLRPDQNICSHYSRYGICKFGPACKFDHPVQPAASPTESGLDSLPHFGNSAMVEETGVAGNGSDN